jgi:hypothetical protein
MSHAQEQFIRSQGKNGSGLRILPPAKVAQILNKAQEKKLALHRAWDRKEKKALQNS